MAEPGGGGFRFWTILLVVVVAVAAGAVILLRHQGVAAQRRDLDRDTATGPAVQVVQAAAAPAVQTVTVLAGVRPIQEATLYAKVSGYLDRVLVDKGDKVKAGQLLATIQSQETEAAYNSARADFLNKQQIARRYAQLLRENAIASQLAAQAEADARVSQAVMEQNATLRSYQRLTAPFDGRVTARFADPGALVQNATTSQTAAQPVVTVSDDRQLRIQAYVQQDVAPFVHEGDVAQIVDAANTGRSVEARITRVSGQLDARTRTMLVEVMLDNKASFLLAGSFAYLTLHVPVPSATQVPVGALITRGDDRFVAVVGEDSRLRYVKVAIGSTNGDIVSLAGGIRPGTRIATDLPAEAVDGSLVKPVSSAPQ